MLQLMSVIYVCTQHKFVSYRMCIWLVESTKMFSDIYPEETFQQDELCFHVSVR